MNRAFSSLLLSGLLSLLIACQSVLGEGPGGADASGNLAATEAAAFVLTEVGTGSDVAGALPTGTATLAPFPESALNESAIVPIRGAAEDGIVRPASFAAPLALKPEEHFYFSFPLPVESLTYGLPSSRYGDDQDRSIYGRGHSGLDIVVDEGTPVMAAGDGTVLWSGYGIFAGEEDFTDAYGVSIAIRHNFGHEGRLLFTVYAHLSQSFVEIGQQVKAGEVIGASGDTGFSSGPHLHFEVRVGENNVRSTRNPELWLAPPEGWGVLVGQMLNTYGRPVKDQPIYVSSLDDESVALWLFSYARETYINSDDYYGETFVVSDLPAGRYEIAIPYVVGTPKAQVEIRPGEVTYFIFEGYRGFRFDLPDSEAPPQIPNP
ncbi:MAG: M23 family peptidase [Chloroflexi bacterium]|nr:M23 family metallopeptidase [Chloroflexota bacterium]MQC27052.1 M23 family peptidase [Chloroflexota bacterium]